MTTHAPIKPVTLDLEKLLHGEGERRHIGCVCGGYPVPGDVCVALCGASFMPRGNIVVVATEEHCETCAIALDEGWPCSPTCPRRRP